MSQEYEYIQRSADGPNYMSIAMTVMEPGVRGLPRLPVPLVGAFVSISGNKPQRQAGPHRGPSSTRTLVSVCCTHPPSRVPSPSLEIGYADPSAGRRQCVVHSQPQCYVNISYSFHVNVQQLVFHGTPRLSILRQPLHERNSSAPSRRARI